MKIYNFTGHPVRIYRGGECIASYPPLGCSIRVHFDQKEVGTRLFGVRNVRVMRIWTDLIPPFVEKGDVILVSMSAAPYVAEMAPVGVGVVAPDTRPYTAVRDMSGRIVGVTGVVVYREPFGMDSLESATEHAEAGQ